jgi:hypothetical protein
MSVQDPLLIVKQTPSGMLVYGSADFLDGDTQTDKVTVAGVQFTGNAWVIQPNSIPGINANLGTLKSLQFSVSASILGAPSSQASLIIAVDNTRLYRITMAPTTDTPKAFSGVIPIDMAESGTLTIMATGMGSTTFEEMTMTVALSTDKLSPVFLPPV